MVKTATIKPGGGYNFEGSYREYGRIQLPGLAKTKLLSPGSGNIPSPKDEADAALDPVVNFRKGIVFYFGMCEVTPPDFSKVLVELGSKKNDFEKAYNEAQKTNWGKNAEVNTIADEVRKKLEGTVGKDTAPQIISATRKAADHVAPKLTNVVGALASQVSVPLAKTAKDTAVALGKAVVATYTYFSSHGLEDAVRTGEPKQIVEAVRRALGKEALKGWATFVYDLGKTVATALTGGIAEVVTKVVEAAAAAITYIWNLFVKARDYFLLEAFFAECKQKLKAGLQAYSDGPKFQAWFGAWVVKLPIIASHCVASSICGSYFGFLSALVSEPELKSAYAKYQSLKDPATNFAKNYELKITSSDAQVKMCLTIMEKGGIDLSNGAAAQSVSWFRRKYMQYGSKIGITKNTLYS